MNMLNLAGIPHFSLLAARQRKIDVALSFTSALTKYSALNA
jgi:hypothetical protein